MRKSYKILGNDKNCFEQETHCIAPNQIIVHEIENKNTMGSYKQEEEETLY